MALNSKSWFRQRLFYGLTATLLLLPAHVIADESTEFTAHDDFFRLLMPNTPDISLRGLYQPENEEDGGPGSFDLQQYSFHSQFALPLSADAFLRFGFDYDLRIYDFERLEGPLPSPSSESLHGLEPKIGAGWFLNDDLLLTGMFEPGIYSDLDNSIDSNDFQWYWRGLAVYRINPQAQLLGGVMYNEVFDDTPLYPVVGIRLQGEDGQLMVNVTFPEEAKVSYSLEPKFLVYAGFWISGDEWQAEVARGGEIRIQTQDRRLGVGTNLWINETFGIGVETGVSIDSELKFKSDDAGEFENGDLDTTGYISVTLGVTL